MAVRARALLTLPNVLSLSRIALVPLFIGVPGPHARVAVVGLAALTDVLDGWLARRQAAATRLGALLDPLADRVFVLGALATLLAEGALALAQGAVLLVRDLATTAGFVVARSVPWLRPVALRSRPAGKVVTALQLAALLAALAWPAALPVLVATTGAAAVVAIADYTLILWRARARA
jgi:CDP-diacylglycerol--glycerol-3-phosphate 3-phosphatidyltransferase/cardiolipin synthase